jgi:LMBR1 domain-containing protein 1
MNWSMRSRSQRNNFMCLFIRLIVSVAWVAHIVIYLLISPPLSPFLNEVFIKLDNIWGNFVNIYIFSYKIFLLYNEYMFC